MLLTDIRQDARSLISPQCTATMYPDVLLDKNANLWYRQILGWAMAEQGEWEINGDYMVIDLEENVPEYEIPVGLIRIYKAEIMYQNGGTYVPLTQISIQRNQQVAAGNATMQDSSKDAPTLEVFGDFLKVDPAPDVAVVNGFKLWAQLDFVDLTEEEGLPDLNPVVHRAISVGAAMDYAFSKEMWVKHLELKRMMFGDPRVPDDDGIKGQVKLLYAIRTGDRRDRVTITRRSYR